MGFTDVAKPPSKIEQCRQAVQAFWDESIFKSNRPLSKAHQFAHFWILVVKSFARNRCPAHAASLAYTTLLALIPMLAVAVSITSTFLKKEGEDRIDTFIARFVSSMTSGSIHHRTNAPVVLTNTTELAETGTTNASVEVVVTNSAQTELIIRARKDAARNIHEFVQNTRSGALGLTGSILLIFVAISMLTRVETTFNDIWGVTRGRTWFMRVVLYWGVLTLAPMLLVGAIGIAAHSRLEDTTHLLGALPFFRSFLLQLLPLVILCVVFAVFYMLMPNAKVRWDSALVGGLVGGLLFHLNNSISVLYVSRVVSNSKIYGSLGLVPVFMIGLYFSWWILLFGAQVAYAWQNRATYLEEKLIENVNQRGREFIALRLMTAVGQRFLAGSPPPTVVEISQELTIPSRLVRQVMRTLAGARLVVETSGAETAYSPARPLETITCHDILLALRASHGQELATRDEPSRAEVLGEFERIQNVERQAAESVTLLALVNRAQSPKALSN